MLFLSAKWPIFHFPNDANHLKKVIHAAIKKKHLKIPLHFIMLVCEIRRDKQTLRVYSTICGRFP